MNDVIDSLMSGDTVSFKERIHDILAGKLADRLETEKVAVAERMFGGDETESYTDSEDYGDDEGGYNDEGDDEGYSDEQLDETFFHPGNEVIKGNPLEKTAKAGHAREIERQIAPLRTYKTKGVGNGFSAGGKVLSTHTDRGGTRILSQVDRGEHPGRYPHERTAWVETRIKNGKVVHKTGKGWR